jgi:hypothetical protein
VYAQCVQLGMPRSRFIALEGRLMNCLHGLPLHNHLFSFSPDGKAKIQLQIVLHDGNSTTFHFVNPAGTKTIGKPKTS